MATAWQSLEEAALTLGISSRTLHRRITKGEFQSRLENGRREVLISIEEFNASLDSVMSDAQAGTLSDTADTLDASQQNEATAAISDDIGSTMLALHEDRIRRT